MITVEKGDTVITREGKTVVALAVYYNGDVLSKIEGIDRSEDSPMRRPVFANQIIRVMKKNEVKKEVADASTI